MYKSPHFEHSATDLRKRYYKELVYLSIWITIPLS
jgi:hypothetical protein